MLDETREDVARNGTHNIEEVLAEMDAIIDAGDHAATIRAFEDSGY